MSKDSVLNSCIPPICSIGKTDSAITKIPTPPSHCKDDRQNNIPGGSDSRLPITVAPVVVMPEMDSNIESVNPRPISEK